jgi:hypothetical protein
MSTLWINPSCYLDLKGNSTWIDKKIKKTCLHNFGLRFFGQEALSKIPHALDEFSFLPIIGRNHKPMNTFLFTLSLIVVILSVLILKDPFSVRMATVRAK